MVTEKQDETKARILASAERLLKAMGRDAITIRAVADEAGVQLPTIYRLFADKASLLDSVAEQGFIKYMNIRPSKRKKLTLLEELREGWDIHVRFGLENPELYSLMFGESYKGKLSPGAQIAYEGLNELMSRVAAAGYLKLSQEQATFTAFASASGAVLTMLSWPDFMNRKSYCMEIRESMISSITLESNEKTDHSLSGAAATLSANLKSLKTFSVNEKNLLQEWLNRISTSA